jgi:hypothetical protein
MMEVLALDWRCSECGEAMTWQLVKPQPGVEEITITEVMTREPPTLDWSCARCGVATTWMLVKK